jgi:hypothetical protein
MGHFVGMPWNKECFIYLTGLNIKPSSADNNIGFWHNQERRMGTEPGVRKRATVTNRAGDSTRVMAASRLAVALAALILIWLGIFVYANNFKNIVSLGLPGTLIVCGGFYLGIKYLEKRGTTAIDRAKHAEKGARAEEKIGDFLDSLPEGHFIIHDFDSGRGNIDHVLICTKGIFTMETKSQDGEVTFDGEKLLRNSRPYPKDFLRQAWAECFAVREILANWGITSPAAEPVILFPNAFVKVRGKARGVEIISLKFKYLPTFLERLPDRLTVPEAGRIYNRVKAAGRSD